MNENEYTDADGVRFVAVERDGCKGCGMLPTFSGACLAATPCSAKVRADGRWIIWVDAKEVSA